MSLVPNVAFHFVQTALYSTIYGRQGPVRLLSSCIFCSSLALLYCLQFLDVELDPCHICHMSHCLQCTPPCNGGAHFGHTFVLFQNGWVASHAYACFYNCASHGLVKMLQTCCSYFSLQSLQQCGEEHVWWQ